MSKINYKEAGVDIAAGNEAVTRIKDMVKTTFAPNVLSSLGSFAALLDLNPILKNYKEPVLVQSIDGVGTKIIVARMMNEFDTIGIDLLSASCNDILVTGAKPLTLLDYIATDHLQPKMIEEIVKGIVKACQENEVSLVGGETAEMPNTYLPGENDLVGIVTGVVEKEKIITGSNITSGDVVIGFPSSGLHTNGYSLARKIFFDVERIKVDSQIPELGQTLGEALLAPHINYCKPIFAALESGITIKGMAHITGGGLLENIPRVLPENCSVKIVKNSWQPNPIFTMMQEIGELDEQEMFRTFNMGIGFAVIVDETNAEKLLEITADFSPIKIGSVITGNKKVELM